MSENREKEVTTLTRLKTEEQIEIYASGLVVGRDRAIRQIDYSIELNSLISRLHAQICHVDGVYYLMDCGSLNKTFLNAEELVANQRYALKDGDIIKFANERFLFSQKKKTETNI